MVQKIVEQHLQFLKTEKKWRWYAVLVITAAILAWLSSDSKQEAKQDQAPPDVTTFIPEGFQLIPIEVANYEALDSVLGQFGVIDLYTASENESSSTPLARAVKILRAPLNPNQFAVLVPDEMVRDIVKKGPLYKVVIRHPSAGGTQIEKSKGKQAKIFHDSDEE